VTFRRLGLIVGWALLAAACGSGGSSLFGARLPASPEALAGFTLADHLQVARRSAREIGGSTSGTRVAALPQGAPAPRIGEPEPYGDRVRLIGVDILDERYCAQAFQA
jgi:hypothetical protein